MKILKMPEDDFRLHVELELLFLSSQTASISTTLIKTRVFCERMAVQLGILLETLEKTDIEISQKQLPHSEILKNIEKSSEATDEFISATEEIMKKLADRTEEFNLFLKNRE